MNKITYLLGISTLTLMLSSTSMAQTPFATEGPLPEKESILQPKVTAAELQRSRAAFREQYPLVAHRLVRHTSRTVNLEEVPMTVPYRKIASAPQLAAVRKAPWRADGIEADLWASLLYERGWNTEAESKYACVKVNKQDGTYATLGRTDKPMNAGVGIVDDILYGIYANLDYRDIGLIPMAFYAYDIDTWEQVSAASMKDYRIIALETAQATDGTVYGEFYTADLKGMQWCVVDYKNQTQRVIGPAQRPYVALGITNDDKLYGIATDGNLYQISTSDGTETLVGSTGLTVTDSNKNYYVQTGEIDPKTNTFYWEYISPDNGAASLETVNLQNGTTTKIADLPNDAELTGMIFPPIPAKDKAPGMATDLSAAFEDASLSGTISFKAPTTTYDGNTLSGSLGYTVYLEGERLDSGQTTPGAVVQAHVTAQEGLDKFVVKTYNNIGSSPRAKVSTYVGYDTPEAPGEVTLSITDSLATVTWAAPAKGLHNGYIGGMSYELLRIASGDTTRVGEGIKALTYTDTLKLGEMKDYVYAVRAHNGTKASAWSNSNGQAAGHAFEAPYTEYFDHRSGFNLFTVTDANNDSTTWRYMSMNGVTHPGTAYYTYHDTHYANDWLISPAIHLEAGKHYVVSFSASNYLNTPERLEVRWGNDTDTTALKDTILPKTELTSGEWQKFEKEVAVETDGYYHLGFHAISDPNAYYLFLDSIRVDKGYNATAPDSVTNTRLIPDPAGDLKATIICNAPTKDLKGKELSSIDSIVVTSEKRQVKKIERPRPGMRIVAVDTAPHNGNNTYKIVAYNDNGSGRATYVTNYVGVDVPEMPQNTGFIDRNSSIDFTWDPVSAEGANGGIVNPDKVTTSLYNVTDGSVADSIGSVTGATDYNLPYDTNEGDQMLKLWALGNSTAAGKSTYVGVGVPVGRAQTLPFKESVAGGVFSNLWWVDRKSGYFPWSYTTAYSADNDGATMAYQTSDGSEASAHTFKISLQGAQNPELIFYNMSLPGTDGTLSVTVTRAGGKTTKVFETQYKDYKDWTMHKVSLAPYTSDNFIVVSFTSSQNKGYGQICVDNIQIRDVAANDLELTSLKAGNNVKRGQTIQAIASVTNVGDNTAEGYRLQLFDGADLVAEKAVSKELASFETTTDTLSYMLTSGDLVRKENGGKGRETVNLKAVVSNGVDLQAYNNELTDTLTLQESELPTPENFAYAKIDAGKQMRFDWNEPTRTTRDVTEDFESYAPWATTFGDWTTINGNEDAISGRIFNSATYPGQGTPFAFIIFNPDDAVPGASEQSPQIAAHSGKQYAAAPYEYNDDGYQPGNNWLISPMLSGDKQTIKFYTHSIGTSAEETFLFYTSTTGNEKADFSLVGTTQYASNTGWSEFSQEVPEGTKYFAIWHNTTEDDAYMFAIDDISYRTGTPAPIGYNIYDESGKLLGSFDANGAFTKQPDRQEPAESGKDSNAKYYLSYTTQTDNPLNIIYVTAVYNGGIESAPVGGGIVTNISSIPSLQQAVDVYSADGKLIVRKLKDLSSLHPGVYVVNGKKIIVK